VDDASGHYTTGYFWGNNYWTGSMMLCRSIFKTEDEDSFFMKKAENSHDGLTTINGNRAGVLQLKHENPPFLPRFGVLKVLLNETITTPTVRIFI
jgi:hypothetical protein